MTNDSPPVDEALLKAGMLARDGEREQAARLYKSILEKLPGNRQAKEGLKALELSAPKTERAASGAEPLHEEIRVLISLYNHGRLQETLEQGAELAKRFPEVALIPNIVGAAYAGLGRLNNAVTSYAQALRLKPDYAEAHNNLGIALGAQGKHEEAIATYKIALQLKPSYATAHNNLGVALWAQGKQKEAIASYTNALAFEPDYAAAHYNLGRSLAALDKHEEAIASYTNALRIKPNYAEAHNSLGIALEALGRYQQAIDSHARAVRIKPNFAEAHNNLGIALMAAGERDQAITSYDTALRIKPDYADAHYNRGIALESRGKYEEAIASYTKTLEIKPEFAEAHNNIGKALAALEKFDDAVVSFTNALRIKPDFAEAHGNLCDIHEKNNKVRELKKALRNAQAHCSADDPQILFRLAQLATREKRYEDAKTYLEAFSGEGLPIGLRCGHSALLSKTYDKLNDFTAAFAQSEITNSLVVESPAAKECDGRRYFKRILQLTKSWSEVPEVDWPGTKKDKDRHSLAFLVGFPRSGTTLLDTVLRSHSKISVIEEMPMLPAVMRQLGKLPTIEILNELTALEIARLRETYLRALSPYIHDSPPGNLVIDKLPLNIENVGLIHRIFPEARFILALRHPCDCVLSCFMQNFKLNDAMANFLDLGQSAKLYDAVMSLWKHYNAKLNLNVGVIKYEDLVIDLKESTEPLLNFLELEWDENLKNYRDTAFSRPRINTPSYNQVTQDLYTHASGRWRNYRAQMEPVLPILEPWAKEWGYGT